MKYLNSNFTCTKTKELSRHLRQITHATSILICGLGCLMGGCQVIRLDGLGEALHATTAGVPRFEGPINFDLGGLSQIGRMSQLFATDTVEAPVETSGMIAEPPPAK